jgi:stage II sporulation protein D
MELKTHGRRTRMRTSIHSAHRLVLHVFRKPLFTTVINFVIFITTCSLALAPAVAFRSAASVSIGVLGLFHPRQLTITAPPGHALVVGAGDQRIVLENSSGVHSASVQLSGNEITLQTKTRTVRASILTVAGRQDEPADFIIAVPEKISRRYRGALEIRPSAEHLLAIVTMDREAAVASIVASENTAETPAEALKAQAVAARSYLTAGRGRHLDFDFCDTTHCQFMREPPGLETAVAKAVEATRGMILVYESKPFAAMYTRSCAGRTRTPAQLSLPGSTYPYFSVECRYCREHPFHWSSEISADDAAGLRSSNEPARLRAARRLGWATIPSNDFTLKKANGGILVEGTGQGHSIGLCQAGGKAMAADGADFRQILSHYYPNSTIVSIQLPVPFSAQRY